jgi:hypothetical protein
LTLKSNEGAVNKFRVSLRYIPVKMTLDPAESINNSGDLRVDVLDAADLPSADRNGLSDPYCKFRLAGKEVFKTKVQKKTLHPAWNEFFETPIKTRIGADFKVDVYDWDFGDKADFLGSTTIDLANLEPFVAKEVTLQLDGKSGVIRMKLLFKPSYVLRSRQGSSTFSGTFATPGKIVGAPVKGIGIVGGGAIKGATFLGKGLTNRFRSHHDHDNGGTGSHGHGNHAGGGDVAAGLVPPAAHRPEGASHSEARSRSESPSAATGALSNGTTTPQRGSALIDADSPTVTPEMFQRRHSRARSFISQVGGADAASMAGDTGTATFTIVSASGFAANTHVRAIVRQLGPKPKELHKTKAIKSPSGSVQWEPSSETFKANYVRADAQFQLRVVDHSTFGSDNVLGEALFFVDDQGSSASKEKTIPVGSGRVVLKSHFVPTDVDSVRPSTSHSTHGETEGLLAPDANKLRRNFLSKRNSSAGASPS